MTPAYCITCEEDPARGQSAAIQFARHGLDVTFFQAVHGKTWGLRTDKECNPATHWCMDPKHVGLNLSHWMLWQHIWLTGAEQALIFEDDALLCDRFVPRLEEAIAELPADWQLVFVGWLDRPEMKRRLVSASADEWEGCPFGTHAYLVRRAALPTLLATNREARTHIDQQIAENSVPLLRAYVLRPSLAAQYSHERNWPTPAPEPVHSLWCGPVPLGLFQKLACKSFMAHGHPFVLWTYTRSLEVPAGVEVRDARDVLPESAVYTVPGPRGGPSLAFFSDLFQLILLHRFGGWFSQMDVACLRPLEGAGHVFAPHFKVGVAAYVMRATAGSAALAWMAARHAGHWGPGKPPPGDWEHSMHLMGDGVRRFHLEDRIVPKHILDDDGSHGSDAPFRAGGCSVPPTRLVHHWCDSQHGGRVPVPGSFFHACLVRHGLAENV